VFRGQHTFLCQLVCADTQTWEYSTAVCKVRRYSKWRGWYEANCLDTHFRTVYHYPIHSSSPPTLNFTSALLLFSPSLTCSVVVPHLGTTILVASFAELYSFPSCICVLPCCSCPADKLLAFQEALCFIELICCSRRVLRSLLTLLLEDRSIWCLLNVGKFLPERTTHLKTYWHQIFHCQR